MADLAHTDFSMKPQVDITAIANVLQRKKQMEIEAQQQRRQQNLQELSQAVQMGTQLTSTLVQRSKDAQKDAFVKSLGDAMAANVPTTSIPVQGPSLPTFDLQGNASDRSSLFPNAPGGVYQENAGPPLPPIQTQDPIKMAQLRAATALDPKAAADAVLKNSTGTGAATGWETKTYLKPDGSIGYVDHNKLTGENRPFAGNIQGTGVTPADRQRTMDIAQQNADTRGENANTNQSRFVTVTGDKLAAAVDPTKLRDYDRLTAGKRLDQFIQSTQGTAIKQQVTEASSLLASMLQGGGRGGVVSEKLIEQLTPSTLKGTAAEKLQWLTNHPESVDQQQFLDLFEKTALREATAGEDNIRQQQVEALKKYEKVKRLDPKRYAEIQQSVGLTDENIDANGRFVRTPNTRSILPNYNDQTSKGFDLGGGFSFKVK